MPKSLLMMEWKRKMTILYGKIIGKTIFHIIARKIRYELGEFSS